METTFSIVAIIVHNAVNLVWKLEGYRLLSALSWVNSNTVVLGFRLSYSLYKT